MKYRTNSPRYLSLGLTLGALVLAGISPGCASEKSDATHETARTGKLGMALETFGSSGNRYRLRNAKFRINDVRTGDRVKTLNSEKDLSAAFLSAELDAGEYTVTLQSGWFLERIGGSNPGPIDPPSPGPFPVPDPDIDFLDGAFDAGAGLPGDDFPDEFFEDDDVADDDVADDDVADDDVADDDVADDDVADDDVADDVSFGGAAGMGGSTGVGGEPVGIAGAGGVSPGGAGGGAGQVVNAQLLSDAIRNVFIEPNQDQFLFYSFRVGDDVVEFGPGRLHVGIEVLEDEPPPPRCDDPIVIERRALFETTLSATSFFNMRDVLTAISENEAFQNPPELLYQQIIDSYNSPDQARLPDAIHCGDEQTNGQPSLNGFPIECDRQERFQFDNLDAFFPTAVVNRFDLAPESGAHCGQQRIIFASNAQNRMFFIFEAQIPNPQPEAGIQGCQPIAEFWATQAQIEDPSERGQRLQQAFLFGLPELLEQGVGPFVSASHYTVGSGQIRTNQFDQDPWTLREFKLAVSDDTLTAIPFPVAEAPNGALWNDSIDTPQGPACREAFINVIDRVLTDDPAEMSFPVPQECKDAESRNDFSQDYPSQLLSGNPNGFLAELEEALDGTGLSPVDFAARAQFSGSCIGCHEESFGRDLGRGVNAPFSNGFVHVNEFTSESCRDDACFSISQALQEVFIPHRKEVLTRFVDLPVDEECEGDDPGPGTDAGVGGSPGNPSSGGASSGGASATPPGITDPAIPPAAPEFTPELPDAEEPIEDLVEQDGEIRESFGSKTLGGQSAKRSH